MNPLVLALVHMLYWTWPLHQHAIADGQMHVAASCYALPENAAPERVMKADVRGQMVQEPTGYTWLLATKLCPPGMAGHRDSIMVGLNGAAWNVWMTTTDSTWNTSCPSNGLHFPGLQ